MLILNRIICIQYMMTQLTRESPVPESVKVWSGPFWHRGDDQGLLNLFTAHSETSSFFFFLRFSFAPDLSLISHSNTTSTHIRTLAVRHCISKWNISKQICYTLLHLWSTEACFFFLSLLRFSLFLTRGLLKLKVHDDKIINLTYFVLIGSI